MRTLVLFGSSRRSGNTEILTERLLDGIDCSRIYLMDHRIEAIVDQRHEPQGFQPVVDDYDAITEQVLAHDRLVFATPLYWYGMTGLMKDYFDRWSQVMRDRRYAFKDAMAKKEAYAVITGGDSARIKGLPLVQQFHYICDFVGMPLKGYLIGQGSKPGDVLRDQRALAEAAAMNQQLRQG
jgi:multimeric flavodoxin WrbA